MTFLAWLRKVQHALHQYAESIRNTEKRKQEHRLPSDKPIEMRAVVSYDENTVTEAKAQAKSEHATQESIKKATWAAFGAVTIYAVVTTLMWCAMIEQNKISSKALRQSTESFRIDERAWIELEPIKPATLFSAATTFIPRNAFTYELYPKNYGKTIARDITMKVQVSDGNEDFGNSADQMDRWQNKFLLNQFTEMGTGKPVVVAPSPIPKVLAPGVSTPVPYVVHPQSPQYFNNGHAMYSYIVGRVDYTDQFGIPHWIKFCFFVRNPRGELTSCQYGNDEDRNPETPGKAN